MTQLWLGSVDTWSSCIIAAETEEEALDIAKRAFPTLRRHRYLYLQRDEPADSWNVSVQPFEPAGPCILGWRDYS